MRRLFEHTPGTPLLVLGLDTRSHNALRRGGFHTVEQIRASTLDRLSALRGMGPESLKRVVDAVRIYYHKKRP